MFYRTTKGKTVYRRIFERGQDPDGRIRQHLVVSLKGIDVPPELEGMVLAEFESRISGVNQGFLPFDERVDSIVTAIKKRYDARQRRLARKNKAKVPVAATSSIILDSVEHWSQTALGTLLPLEAAWKALRLDVFLRGRGFSNFQINALKVCVYSRLQPSLPGGNLSEWLQTTSLPEMLGMSYMYNTDEHYLAAAEKLYECKKELERYLAEREQQLFQLDRSIALYFLTPSLSEVASIYAERGMGGGLASRGSEDNLLLVLRGMSGFPFCHDYDSLLSFGVEDVIAEAASFKEDGCVPGGGIVMLRARDATPENISALRAAGMDYAIGFDRNMLRLFYNDFLVSSGDGDGERNVPCFEGREREGNEQIIICRSKVGRSRQDAAMLNEQRRFLEKLTSLAQRVASAPSAGAGRRDVRREVAAICRRYPVSQYYEIEYSDAGQLLYRCKEEEFQKRMEEHGCWRLRSSRWDLTDEEMWRLYATAALAEANLALLNPWQHYNAEGGCGISDEVGVLIQLVALHLMMWVQRKLWEHGLDINYGNLQLSMENLRYFHIEYETTDGMKHSVCMPSEPDSHQKEILDALGIDLTELPHIKKNSPV